MLSFGHVGMGNVDRAASGAHCSRGLRCPDQHRNGTNLAPPFGKEEPRRAWFTYVMKIGVTTFLTDEGIRPAQLARALEERAFDSLLLHEHSHVAVKQETPFPGGGKLPGMYYRTLDPFVALTAAATVTSDLVLGTGVALLVQRDVIQTAKQVASLDLVSGGRVLFGVGTGWSREEMRNHGVDPRTRGK